jgi:hypothetical protein
MRAELKVAFLVTIALAAAASWSWTLVDASTVGSAPSRGTDIIAGGGSTTFEEPPTLPQIDEHAKPLFSLAVAQNADIAKRRISGTAIVLKGIILSDGVRRAVLATASRSPSYAIAIEGSFVLGVTVTKIGQDSITYTDENGSHLLWLRGAGEGP